jgi:polyisoprenoid-binding protein YceI
MKPFNTLVQTLRTTILSILMLKYALLLPVMALISSTTFVKAEGWQLRADYSEVSFIIRNAGVNVFGEFEEFKGDIHMDWDDHSNSYIRGVVPVASVNTGIGMRDRDLRSDNFFDADKYPEITFESSSIRKKEEGIITVTGNLTIKDVTQEVTFDMRISGTGNARLLTADEIPLNRREFGVGGRSLLLSNNLRAKVQLAIVRR